LIQSYVRGPDSTPLCTLAADRAARYRHVVASASCTKKVGQERQNACMSPNAALARRIGRHGVALSYVIDVMTQLSSKSLDLARRQSLLSPRRKAPECQTRVERALRGVSRRRAQGPVGRRGSTINKKGMFGMFSSKTNAPLPGRAAREKTAMPLPVWARRTRLGQAKTALPPPGWAERARKANCVAPAPVGLEGRAAPAPAGLEGLESKKLIAIPLPQWG